MVGGERSRQVDLCPKDPGFPVDLYVTTDIRTMIDIWFAKVGWDAAIRAGHVEVIGERHLRKRLGAWLLLSPITLGHDAAAQSTTMGRPPVAA